VLILDADAVRTALPFGALVAALRDGFAGAVTVPPRHVHAIACGGAHGTALLMPAWREGGPLGAVFGVKTVNVFPGNATRGLPAVHAAYTLFDGLTGAPLAQIDGSELTARRTAAASALAADFLARDDARSLLLVGAGRVASLMPAALRAVRPGLASVAVFNRSAATADALACALREQGLDAATVNGVGDLPNAVSRADIVSCATLAEAPLVQGDWLRPGLHLDLIGSFTPTMRESDAACFARSRVFVDTEEALAKAGDVLQAIAEGGFDPAALQGTLAALCRGERAGRQSPHEVTLFKSVGTALEDLVAAELAVQTVMASEARRRAASPGKQPN
jgi:ornithine cyclodeaminase